MNRKQAGFGAIGVLAVFIVACAIGCIGWFVWRQKQASSQTAQTTSSNNTSNPAQQPTHKAQVQLPSGWTWYQGEGFRFALPQAYKSFSVDTSQYKYIPAGAQRTWNMWSSSEPSTPIFPGISGKFVLIQYDDVSTPITSKKYGPTVKLVNGQWIVTQSNPGDVKLYKVGDVYTEFSKINNTGITVYTATSGDEGGVSNDLFFAVKNHLYNVELPGFEVGGYPGQTSNDQKPYDQLAAELASTIMPL